MPYKIEKGAGSKPYKIVNAQTGEQVGASKSKADAQASINARLAGEYGFKPTKK